MKVVLGPADFSEGQMRGYQVGRRNVVVFFKDGKYKALDDWCNHAGCLLSGGRIEENLVICPCHEVGFDIDTGKNVTSPSICDDQPTISVQIEDGKIVLDNFNPFQ